MTNTMSVASIYLKLSGDETPTTKEMYQYLKYADSYGSIVATASIIQDSYIGTIIFGDALTNADKVRVVFFALFNREPLESGLNYWVDQMENNSNYVNVTSMTQAILKGAEVNDDQTDWNYVKSYALEFSNELENYEENSLDDEPIIVEVENVSPIANAGLDVTMTEGEVITLDAGLSYDTDGQIESYSWTKNGVVISTEESFSFSTSEIGEHNFILEITDDDGSVSTDSMIVNVEEEYVYCPEIPYVLYDDRFSNLGSDFYTSGQFNLEEEEMNGAVYATFEPNNSANQIYYIFPEKENIFTFLDDYYYGIPDIFQIEFKKGATYDIFTDSFYTPFFTAVYNSEGSRIYVDDNDGSFVNDFIAPYDGKFYVEAAWHDAYYFNDYVSISIYEDLDTISNYCIA